MPTLNEAPVSVTPASEADRTLLAGMAQFYIYDFSEMARPGAQGFDFDANGSFGPMPYFDDYWREAGRVPLIIRSGETPCGFAMLNTHSHRGGTVERNMGEFFVARRYRRNGLASAAVAMVLAQYPGCWEVAVAEYNHAALTFWPRAIAASPNVSDLVRHEGDGTHWSGPIWSFTAR